MDFELSEQQTAFRDLMRDFARRTISPVAREWELAGRYPSEIVDEMKSMGLFGMLVPEEFGGIAIDAVSYALVFEEISKAWMGVAGILGSHSLATLMLAHYGTPKQRARWLPDLATGERRSGIALTEPQAGSDLQGIATVARRADDHYVVNGAKTWITNARHADPLPVLVKTDPEALPRHRGMTILMIEQGTPGFAVGSDLDKLGYRGPESSEVFLSDCHVPVENVLGGEEGHWLQQALGGTRIWTSQHRRAGGRCSPGESRPLAHVRARAPRFRPAHCRVPSDPAEARRHGHRSAGRTALDLVGGPGPRLWPAGRPRDRYGEALCLGGVHQSVFGGDANSRRIWLLDRI